MAVHGHTTVAAILVAAGSGERLGAAVPKAFVIVAGRTLLEHAASRFVDHPDVSQVIVVAPAAMLSEASRLVPSAVVVAGGATRQQSVAAGLAVLADDIETVLVHDVARAFVSSELISRVLRALLAGRPDGAIPTMPVTDTIRRSDPATGDLHELVDRSTLLAMQTPQGFKRTALVEAHAEADGLDATDDAALVEARGGRVIAVRGDERAFKVTVPFDLVVAEALINDPSAAEKAEGRGSWDVDGWWDVDHEGEGA